MSDFQNILRNVSNALDAIGGKWKMRIIIAMTSGNSRFSDIHREVTGISARVLSSELKKLEMSGLILKKVENYNCSSIGYELSPIGKKLEEVITELKK